MTKLLYLPEKANLKEEALNILNDEHLNLRSDTPTKRIEHCLTSFGGDLLGTRSFLSKYALRNNENELLEWDLEHSKHRWAKKIYDQEVKFSKTEWPRTNYSDFVSLYNYFLPGGRQMYALGNDYLPNITLSNCYTDIFEEDSIEGIFLAALRMAKVFSYGGGLGIDLSPLRPAGSRVSNSARFSSGSVSFMPLFDTVTKIIGQEGRRAALLMSMRVNHPDILGFIASKTKEENDIKHANISVMFSDEFFTALKENKEFELIFTTKKETISSKVAASIIWSAFIKAARDHAEPGALFWDTCKKYSTSEIYPELQIVGVNACSEQCLDQFAACCLGSLLLHKFVLNPYTPEARFDYGQFEIMTRLAVRHLDNVIEIGINQHPLSEQTTKAKLGRRIGLGFTGLADCFAALGLKYGNPESIAMLRTIMRTKHCVEYETSTELAEERGSFPIHNSKIHWEQPFFNRIAKEGNFLHCWNNNLRNVAISTVAPSGTLSLIAQCSSGIEPVLLHEMDRTVKLGSDKEKIFRVKHYGLLRAQEIGVDATDLYPMAHEIDWKDRIDIQAEAQLWTDASISSTINLPRDVSIETVEEIYLTAYQKELKGVTIYREGSRKGVLRRVGSENCKQGCSPDTICYKFKAESGDKFYVHVSYQNGDKSKPYQVFTSNYKATEYDRFIKLSNELKKLVQDKGIPSEFLKGLTLEDKIDEQIGRSKNTLEKLTRFLSLALKCGYVDDVLTILDGHKFAGSLAWQLHKILSYKDEGETCPACGGTLAKTEGCFLCMACGYSKCGG